MEKWYYFSTLVVVVDIVPVGINPRLFDVGFLLDKTMKLPTLKPRLQPTKTTTHTPKQNWGKGRGGRPWRRLKDEILLRDMYTCQHCGRVGGQLELDHIINIAQGGTDDKANLQTLCRDCHSKKTSEESQAGGVKKSLKQI